MLTTSYATVPTYASYDQVRMLYVAGLPDDIKPREIYSLFREFPGYESSHLRSPSQNSQPFALASFADQPPAVAAMHELNSEKNSHAAVAGIQLLGCFYASGGWFSILKRDQPYKLILQNVMPDLSTQGQVCWRVLWILDGSPDSDQSHGGHILLKAHIAGFGSVHLPGMTISAFNTISIPICTKVICTS
ncbi:hypothetical protein NC653_013843 [Populus alba x Populus x berolinensis]|uniref:RRM domain-containing protein n=1 Tax=Populus alba x Populus x berolinensis TaxID=444605 RepID=A0AAD6QWE9_9ROSI|nr:hypothetical protein NC653_013843 [Populus alba x Populus x berolinensis]